MNDETTTDAGTEHQPCQVQRRVRGLPPLQTLSMDTMLRRLNEKWGFVDVMPVGGIWRCGDSTDEGLGPNRFEFYAPTPLIAVYRAYRTIHRCY